MAGHMMAFLKPAKDPERPDHGSGRCVSPIKVVDHFESIRSVLLSSVSGCKGTVVASR
jgi:hypothetical protein